MKNLPIVVKFLSIMALFGVFALAVAIYSTGQMRHIDDSYTALMAGNDVATLETARAARSFEAAYAAEAMVQIAIADEDVKLVQADLKDAQNAFIDNMDKAAAAAPAHADSLNTIKANGLDVINNQCAKAFQLGVAANTDALTLAAQVEFMKNCAHQFLPVINDLKGQISQLTDETKLANDGLTTTTDHTIMITYSAIIGGLLLVLGLGFAGIRNWVVQPIAALMATMARLSKGGLPSRGGRAGPQG